MSAQPRRIGHSGALYGEEEIRAVEHALRKGIAAGGTYLYETLESFIAERR